MATSKELHDKIERITNLPTLPEIVTRVMHIIHEPTTSARDVAFAIGQDLALSAKMLRLANSAFYGIPRSITSIHNAVVVLGFKVINTMVLGLTVFDMFPHDKRSALFNRTAFWRHCTSCGAISRFLVEQMTMFFPFDAEEAFCAGLLHDIGKVVMEQYLHEDFHKALRHAKSKKIPLYEAEKEILGYAHTDVSRWLTTNWELPGNLLSPIIHHHLPSKAKNCRDMATLCHYADYLCYELKLTVSEDYVPPFLDQEQVQRLGISEQGLEKVKIRLGDELEKINLFCDIASGN
ncbi:MAG: HDOD domain-containing protein [Chitinivibrionales bacterium]